ncbi:MAG: DUF4278 domain-containing protein [Cyanobacteria bacterium J06592_8]
MKLTYRGQTYNTDNAAVETAATEAKYRGQTYTATNTPEASTAKALSYRGVSYNAENDAVSQPSTSTDSTSSVPAFG